MSRSTVNSTANRKGLLMLFVLAVFQTACVSNISSQVKAENKDETGVFDGRWIGNVQKSAGRQNMPGNWIAHCNGNPWELAMNVRNGSVEIRRNNVKKTTYVDASGNFRFDVPLDGQARAFPGTVREIGLSKRSFILYGNLKKAVGRVTFGVKEFGYSGCTAVVKFKQQGTGV